jgi:ketosteroid isomerase-like protein
MANGNVELVERLLAAFDGGDLETALPLLDPDIRVYPRSEEPGVKNVYEGHEGLFAYIDNWFSQWDEYKVETVSLKGAPGDRVLVVMAERGHLKQSGITLDQEFSHSWSVSGGKATEWRMYDSHAQALEALGLED